MGGYIMENLLTNLRKGQKYQSVTVSPWGELKIDTFQLRSEHFNTIIAYFGMNRFEFDKNEITEVEGPKKGRANADDLQLSTPQLHQTKLVYTIYLRTGAKIHIFTEADPKEILAEVKEMATTDELIVNRDYLLIKQGTDSNIQFIFQGTLLSKGAFALTFMKDELTLLINTPDIDNIYAADPTDYPVLDLHKLGVSILPGSRYTTLHFRLNMKDGSTILLLEATM